MTLIEGVAGADAVAPADPETLAYLTQTALSVDDTAEMIAVLERRFPDIRGPKGEDICYATSNRQAAVKAIAPRVERMLVIGAPNSSNSVRLVEVADREGVPAKLIQRAPDIDWDWLGTPTSVGITAGASAPELLVQEVLEALSQRFVLSVEEAEHVPEGLTFKLPRELVA